MTCDWWWTALAFVGGIGVGQVLLMTALVLMSGGSERDGDEHERGSA
jgi:hypothetical protein